MPSLFVQNSNVGMRQPSPMKHVFTVLIAACLLPSTSSQAIEYGTLVKAVTAVESAGNPLAVGLAGERGLMQIKSGTWRDMTQRTYGEALPFEYAFHSRLNQRMGRAYLEYIAESLESQFDAQRQDDFLRVLVASYNLGPSAVSQHNYAVHRLPQRTRDYVNRVLNMYEYHLSASSPQPRAEALSSQGLTRPVLEAHMLAPVESPELTLQAAQDAARTTYLQQYSASWAPATEDTARHPLPFARRQQASMTTLLPLFMLAVIWSLYRAHLRSLNFDRLLDEILGAEVNTNMEFDFSPSPLHASATRAAHAARA